MVYRSSLKPFITCREATNRPYPDEEVNHEKYVEAQIDLLRCTL